MKHNKYLDEIIGYDGEPYPPRPRSHLQKGSPLAPYRRPESHPQPRRRIIMHDENPVDIQLSPEEKNALPDKVKKHIAALEGELKALTQTLSRDSDELRRKRYAYWKR
jgi:hypothetical protein